MGSKNKKKSNASSGAVSPLAYIKSGQARKLPISKCFVLKNWQEGGLVHVIVSRQHVTGNITAGLYMVDVLCAGVKDTLFLFNEPEEELQDMLDKFASTNGIEFEPCVYTVAHNIIFAGVEFAAEYGIEPHADFAITKMILEEDDENVELVDIECGEEGMPVLIDNGLDARTGYYLKQLKKYAGEGNYKYITGEALEDDVDEDDMDSPEPEFWTKEEWEYFFTGKNSIDVDLYREVTSLLFEKVILQPELKRRNIDEEELCRQYTPEITNKPLTDREYANTPEETEASTTAYYMLDDSNAGEKELKDLIVRLQDNIRKWPHNPIFHNHLYNAYLYLEKNSEADTVMEKLLEKFPDYFFARISYALRQINLDNTDAIPGIFDGHRDLASLCPERKAFHISEFLGFSAVWCIYYVHKNDPVMADVYALLLSDNRLVTTTDSFGLAQETYRDYIIKKTAQVMIDVEKNEAYRKEVIELLTA